jgi:hypothetical protein
MPSFDESTNSKFKKIIVDLLRIIICVLSILLFFEVVRLLCHFIFTIARHIFGHGKIWVYGFWGVGTVLISTLLIAVLITAMHSVGNLLRKRHPHSIKYPQAPEFSELFTDGDIELSE